MKLLHAKLVQCCLLLLVALSLENAHGVATESSSRPELGFGSKKPIVRGSPAPIHDESVSIQRQAPGGPDPIHHDFPPADPGSSNDDSINMQRQVPGDPNPIRHDVRLGGQGSRNDDFINIKREVPRGPDPVHHGVPGGPGSMSHDFDVMKGRKLVAKCHRKKLN
ncbi:hypothetical protein ACLOJK_038927 [Asimina triloba]